jgi:hypothetical protein
MNIRQRKNRERRIRQLSYLMIAFIAVFVYLIWLKPIDPLPDHVRKAITFNAIILPQKTITENGFRVDATSFKTFNDGSDVIFTYQLIKPGNRITFTEQEYPEVLIYDKLVNGTRPYSEISTSIGKVSLGRPAGSKGKQVAVSNPNGLLLFAYPEKDLADNDWREIFNSLESVK